MDNIRNVIKILFRYRTPAEVLSGEAKYNDVRRESFIQLANAYMPQYSNNEIENMLRFLGSEFEWHNNKIRGQVTDRKQRAVNVFDAILLFADNVLVEENGTPLCRYENLLRWRDMIIALEEDLFITSFLAQKDLLHPEIHRQFFWPPVIGHNNKSLNRLMAQGVAENHFHLKGSAPLFHLSWISMMNHVQNQDFRRTLEGYDDRRLHMKTNYSYQYADPSLYISYLQAALIRLYFFACLQKDSFVLRGGYIKFARIKPFLQETGGLEDTADGQMVKLEDYWERIRPRSAYQKLEMEIMQEDVVCLLHDTHELRFRLGDIQTNIELMTEKYAVGQLDYTICHNSLARNYDRGLNEVISGERWFLYEIFKRIYSGDRKFKENLNWFYAYLLIKEDIRSELIQSNDNVGFCNFLLYQNRKEAFIENTPFEPIYLRMAVRDTILNQHIKKLEARITPKNTPEELRDAIRKNDHAILNKETCKESLKDHFFYVCHFIKDKDEELDKEDRSYEFACRHYRKRMEIKRQAHAILEFRRTSGRLAERLRGIDASSEEIGCRPEVFAQAFRFLKTQSVERKDEMTSEICKLPDLCITYHVGEDFLDLTDGLRAIDEAVSFLNMRCGDRLGHALALGIDVEEWYESKSGYVLIPQIDYLDNLVWLYSKIRKYRLTGLEDTLRYIEKRYDEYFRMIYLNHMSEGHLSVVFRDAIEYYNKKGIQHNYGNKQCVFSINTYYDSWKLRGDDPMYFQNGYFKIDSSVKTEWDESGINKVFPENYRIRYNPEASYLYHTYHFNEQVKKEGNQRKEIKINPCIIKAVKVVQKRMQWVIAQKGIGIETNPSSNALIGTFKRYDKHPILNWYNNGLALGASELYEVPQLQVSINTDDQGVFATYIENEYAYLALALEKMRDKNGNPKYSRTLIYQWLDNVRKMGLTQSFEEITE